MLAVPEEWLILVEHIEDVHIVIVPASHCANGEAKSVHHDRQRAAFFRVKWGAREPAAVACFFTDFDKPLAYLKVAFPAALFPLIPPRICWSGSTGR
jgi:hypothetical protein